MSLWPDRRKIRITTPAADLRLPQLDVIVEQKLIQLRRRHRGAGQHGVHLAAMVNVVQEDMGENVSDLFGDHAVLAPVGDDAAIEIGLRQAIAEGDQPPVGRDLGGKQRPGFVEGHELIMGCGTDAALFEKIEIEVIDRKDVVERCLDRREEAGAFGFEFAKLQLQHGTIEPVVRPQIVAAHAAQMVKQGHEIIPLTAPDASLPP